MKKRIQKLALHPISSSIGAALCLSLSWMCLKQGLLKLPLPLLTFFWFLFRTPLHFPFNAPLRSYKIKTRILLHHLLISFMTLGLYISFFGALQALPLTNASALFLMFPLYIPWVLRHWMGKKINKRLYLGLLIAFIGALFSFSIHFKWNNVLVLLGISAGMLQALKWVGSKRLKLTETSFTIWFYESLVTLSASALLMISSVKHFRWELLFWVVGAAFLEKLSQYMISQRFTSSIPSFEKVSILNLAIFMGAVLDLFVFHSLPPFHTLLCAILIYLGLFLTFLQKNILPNPLYPL